MINTIKIKLRSAVACCWEAACLGCMALLMPFFGGSEVFSRNQVMSKDSEKRMRMTSKSSHSLVQRIHHALKRKDPVPASREAHGNGAIPQFSNVETEISMSLAVFVVTEAMFPAFFWCNDRNFLRVSTSFFFLSLGGEEWSLAACLTNHRNGVDSLPPFTTQTLAGWRWQYDLAVAALLDRVFVEEGVTLGMSVGMYPDVPSKNAQGRFKDEI